MGANTKIEWAHHTFNPWRGCTKVAAGCTNCYADTLSKRNPSTLGIWGPNGTRVRAADAAWREPLKWNKAAAEQPFVCSQCGTRYFCESGASPSCNWKCNIVPYRPRVFCASLADVFEDWPGRIINSHGTQLYIHDNGKIVPMDGTVNAPFHSVLTLDDLRRDLFALIDATPHLDWLVLTKRPENIDGMWPGNGEEVYRPNVWLLASANDQETFDRNCDHLRHCDALCPIVGLSLEPMTAPIRFCHRLWHDSDCPASRFINWIIVGGESGHDARPFNIEWARSIREQCAAAGVPCFVKQLGAKAHQTTGTNHRHPDWISWLNLADKKGGDWEEWPADLRVRQFPDPALSGGEKESE